MVKHSQTISQQSANELFECVWPFCKIGASRFNVTLCICRNIFKQLAQPSRCFNFLKSLPSRIAYFFHGKTRIPLHRKSNICNFRWIQCYFQYVLLKITLLLHLALILLTNKKATCFSKMHHFESCLQLAWLNWALNC